MEAVGIKKFSPKTYPRGILVKPEILKHILTMGYHPVDRGYYEITDTGGKVVFPPITVQPNTAMWVVNTQPFDSQLMFAAVDMVIYTAVRWWRIVGESLEGI
ncbi:MAG: hypothetical protein CM1200mP35_01070 [Chloroflexota bacterium]|nr:MAG: hypothetical protein CM1200mP35_01070 [Chloroflexota bacterium]